MLEMQKDKIRFGASFICGLVISVLSIAHVAAASLDLDGRYILDAEATENSVPYLKLMDKNPAEKMGFQIFSQLMDSLSISGETLKSAILECKLSKAAVGFDAACVNALSKENISYEIVVDGPYLILLEKQYPIFFKAPDGKTFPKLD